MATFDGKDDASDKETIRTPDGMVRSDTAPWPGIPASGDIPAGTRIGAYRVEAMLGKGGFGAVYKALDMNLDRPAALKFLREGGDATHKRMFAREAKAIARLKKHPNIVDIYAWGDFQGYSYFAMEFVPECLSGLLKRMPDGLPVQTALRIIIECADALEFAHSQGVIHRDIKPANILLETDSGPARLADFGLTRLLDTADSMGPGAISGSPPYMSPEQAGGNPTDSRSDIFSLGVTLYEALSHGRLYEGASTQDVLASICRDARVPLRKRKPGLPDEVYDIVDKATAYKPKERYQTARAFADDMRKLLRRIDPGLESTITSGAPISIMKPLGHWLPIAAGLALILIAGAYMAGQALRNNATNPTYEQASLAFAMGDAAKAADLFGGILKDDPSNDTAGMGLGYALQRQGMMEEAAAAFGEIQDPAKRAEGTAALRWANEGATAREAIAKLIQETPSSTPYARAILASLDLGAGQADSASAALAAMKESDFLFAWQWLEARQTLGQACYQAGELELARTIFNELGGNKNPQAGGLASAYLGLIERQARKVDQEAALQRANDINELAKQQPETAAAPGWSSRPWTFFVLPVDASQVNSVGMTNLAGCLPTLLADTLDTATPMRAVDRELIGDVLAEQKLSALTSSGAGQLRLGQVLGARLIIRCEFMVVGGKSSLRINAVNVETTDRVTAPMMEVTPGAVPSTLAESIAKTLWEGVASQYPIQAMLRAEDGRLRMDVGEDMGVTAGMRFAVASKPDPFYKSPGVFATVEGPLLKDSAEAKLDGMTMEQIPPDGLYLFQERGATPTSAPER